MHLNFFSSTWVRDRESLVRDSNALIKLNVLLFSRLLSSLFPVFVTLWRGHLIYWPCIPIVHKCCKLQIKRRSFVCMHWMGIPWRTYLIQRHFLVISCCVDCELSSFFASMQQMCRCIDEAVYLFKHWKLCVTTTSLCSSFFFFFEKLKHTAQYSAHCYMHLDKIVVSRFVRACFLLLFIL